MRKQPTPIVRVEGLTKHFGRHVAVDGVSFDVAPGGSLGIVGESGSGKTTIARMLAGLEAPTSGTVEVCGYDRSQPATRAPDRRARARELQIVFQDPYSTLDPRQTVSDCILETLRLHQPTLDDPDRLARADELADLVGLDQRQRRALPRRLSGGQRQRVAIARALAVQPQVLILDEAVSALDVSIQAQILNLLADIRAATGISYLMISHDLAVIRQLTNTCVVLRDGRVVEAGDTADVLDHPRDAYTQRLRASVPRPGWRPSRQASHLTGDLLSVVARRGPDSRRERLAR
jgi:oligopeptide transport system ATP-binding protein